MLQVNELERLRRVGVPHVEEGGGLSATADTPRYRHFLFHSTTCILFILLLKVPRDSSGDPVAKTLAYNAGGQGLIPA